MPKISEFFGIKIIIQFREHGAPHFHAIYGDEEASIGIHPLTVLAGHLNNRALGMVMEWAALHNKELIQAWNDTQTGKLPQKIEPLQ